MKPATVRTLQAESRTPSGDELLRLILAELRGLRADWRRGEGLRALQGALADEFADAGFTVAGLLELAAIEPDSDIARVLGELIDMGAGERSRTTSLGRLLASLPGIEVCGDRRGSALYRLADFGR
jgi:hypothetical protein